MSATKPKRNQDIASSPPPTLVCIDVSYLLFYRINALKRWHQHAHKHITAKDKATTSSPTPDLCTDLFRTKLGERLDSTVLDLAKTHRATHVLLAFDGRRNWRKDVHTAYKGTRTYDDGVLHLFRHGVKHLHASFGVDGTCVTLPLRGRKKLPPPVYTLLAHDALEADDTVHYVTRTYHDTCAHVTIVANDHDYLPLLVYPNVSVVKLPKCAPLTLPKGIDTGDAYLTYKVLTGDKSDNLGKVFAKLSKANATRIANDLTGEALRNVLDNADDETRARWARNEQLIDNRLVPVALRAWLNENSATCFTVKQVK